MIMFNETVVAEDLIITNIEIKGTKRINVEKILGVVRLKSGEKFSQKELSEDLQRIYKLGFFKNISSKAMETNEGISIITIVSEKPIMKIEILGEELDIKRESERFLNDAVGDKELFYSKEQEGKWKEILTGFYRQMGYYKVKITSEVKIDEDKNTASLTFNVKEGDVVKVRSIVFVGNTIFEDKELKKIMQIKEKALLRDGVFREPGYLEGLDNLTAVYNKEGYAKAKITSERVKLDEEKNEVEVLIKIEEGSKYKVGKIELDGNKNMKTEYILSNFILKQGEILDREKFSKDMKWLGQYYKSRGYFKIKVSPFITFNEEEKKADIVVKVEEGEIHYVNKIRIEGNEITKERVIRQEITLLEGYVLNAVRLEQSIDNLKRLGYLGKINVKMRSTSEKNTYDVVFKVEDKGGANMFEAGYNYYTDIYGSTVFLKTEEINLLGNGQNLSLKAEYGKSKKDYSVIFIEPRLFGTKNILELESHLTTTNEDFYCLQRIGGLVAIKRPVAKYTTASLGYRYEKVNIYDIERSEKGSFPGDQIGVTHLAGIISSVERVTTNDIFCPTKGSMNKLIVDYGSQPLGGSSSYVKSTIESQWYASPVKNWIFMAKMGAGAASKLAGSYVPVYEKFYVGGQGTVRGYEAGELSPQWGADVMCITTLEYRYKFADNVFGSLFWDAGYGWERTKDISFSGLEQGVGLGLAFKFNAGQIRVDYAFPADKIGENGELYFTIGGEF